MEATTPPNTLGFKKLTRKNRKTFRSRNSGYHKLTDITMDAYMPSDATAWLYGSMFFLAAAKILAPLMGVNAIPVQPATSSAE